MTAELTASPIWSTACLSPSPVGVRLLRSIRELGDVPEYHGISFCDAVRQASEGRALRVIPGSIQVCRWAPVVLGLERAESRFDEHLTPRLAYPIAGLLLAPLHQYPGEPQVVLVRARPDDLRSMIKCARAEGLDGNPPLLWEGHEGQLDRSVIPLFAGGRLTARHRLVGSVNHVLAALARSSHWRSFTYRLFRSRLTTAAFDVLISHTLADMSVCRNSTVIPLQSDQVNISYFCTGGISWGLNQADYMTAGWPWHVFRNLT